jgi:ParB family chromosome partitioning protein
MSETVQYLDINLLFPNKLNPRLGINAEKINELTESIKKVGIIQPIIARSKNNGYEIVIGERRYRAAQNAGLKKIPVIIKNLTDSDVMELNLIENVHREELSAVEKGRSCKHLMKEFHDKYPTIETVAERIGVSPQTIRSWLLLTEAPLELQKMITSVNVERRGTPLGSIDYTTANTIIRQIKDPSKQIQVAKVIAYNRNINQKTARRIIKEITKEPTKSVNEVASKIIDEPYNLPFRFEHMDPINKGIKTQTSRRGIPDYRVKEGAIVRAAVWEPNFASLKIDKIERKKLSKFTDQDAKREGGYTLEEFQRVWKNLHGNWDPEEAVYIIHFKKV